MTTTVNRTIAEWVIPRPEWNAKWQVCSGYHTPAGLNWWTLPKDRNSITERDRIPIPVPNFCKDLNACHDVLTDERWTDEMWLDLTMFLMRQHPPIRYSAGSETKFITTILTLPALTLATAIAEVIEEIK